MAVEEQELDQEEEQVEEKGGGFNLMALLQPLVTGFGIFIGVLGAMVMAPMVTEYLNREPEVEMIEDESGEMVAVVPEIPDLPPIYLPLDPPLVVNFEEDEVVRFLQMTMEVMAREQAVIDDVQGHMPVIRNNLLMLFGSQNYNEINTREGKERLRAEALQEIQAILVKNTGRPGIEDVYFTSFVVQ